MKYLLTLIISSLFLIIAPACVAAQPAPRPVPPSHHVRLLPPPPSQKHHKRLQLPRVKYGEYCYYVPVPTPHYECESYHIRRDYAPVSPSPPHR